MMDNSVGILLVEDDEVDVMNVQRSFKRTHINNPLYIASDGIQALELLHLKGSEKLNPFPKLILLDINMPRMNGIEFLQELRSDPELKHLTVIMLTTSNEERDIVAAYDFNVAGYILKPVDIDDFIKAISAMDMYWSLCQLP